MALDGTGLTPRAADPAGAKRRLKRPESSISSMTAPCLMQAGGVTFSVPDNRQEQGTEPVVLSPMTALGGRLAMIVLVVKFYCAGRFQRVDATL